MVHVKKELTVDQKVFIVKKYYWNHGNLNQTNIEFQQSFGTKTNQNIFTTFRNVISNFETSGGTEKDEFFESEDNIEQDPIDQIVEIEMKDGMELNIEKNSACGKNEIVVAEDIGSKEKYVPMIECSDPLVVVSEVKKTNNSNKKRKKFSEQKIKIKSNIVSNQNEIDSSSNILQEQIKTEEDRTEDFIQLTESKQASNNTCKILIKTFKKKKEKKTYKKDHVCEICGKVYVEAGVYRQHVKIHEDMKFDCPTCGKTFTTALYLKIHLKTHNPNKVYKIHVCDICGHKSNSKVNHKRHMIVHSDVKPYSCDICGLKFARSTNMKVHTRIHTKEKPYACKFCDRSFSAYTSWATHTRSHTGEKPFQCKTCNKSFSNASARNYHQQNRHKEKCLICEELFSNANVLQRHIRKVHKSAKDVVKL